MQDYAICAESVPFVENGTYAYTRVNCFGPATPVRVTVQDGTVVCLVLGLGRDMDACPAKWLPEAQRGTLQELAWHIRYGRAARPS